MGLQTSKKIGRTDDLVLNRPPVTGVFVWNVWRLYLYILWASYVSTFATMSYTISVHFSGFFLFSRSRLRDPGLSLQPIRGARTRTFGHGRQIRQNSLQSPLPYLPQNRRHRWGETDIWTINLGYFFVSFARSFRFIFLFRLLPFISFPTLKWLPGSFPIRYTISYFFSRAHFSSHFKTSLLTVSTSVSPL